MKANELMIGDWVVGCSGKPFKIGIIDPDFLYWNEIQPIPLTKEILEKNGFLGDGYVYLKIDEHSFLEYYFHEKRLRKIWKGVDEWQNHAKVRDITFQCNCYYVHELQHALRLCGITREIII